METNKDTLQLSDNFLHPKLNEALASGSKEDFLALIEPKVHGVFSFPCFTKEFCNQLISAIGEMESKGTITNMYSSEGISGEKPNSMNRYGVMLNKTQLKGLMNDIVTKIVVPFATHIFSVPADDLKHNHSFTVRYQIKDGTTQKFALRTAEAGLKKHTDDSLLTLNVCLGKEFEGGEVVFKGLKDTAIQRIPSSMHPYQKQEQLYAVKHEIGTALIHWGSHVHGANPVQSGERINLIIWCKKERYDDEL